jgi:hypothetical protein
MYFAFATTGDLNSIIRFYFERERERGRDLSSSLLISSPNKLANRFSSFDAGADKYLNNYVNII